MRRGKFLISPEFLAEALHLPAGNQIAGLEWDYAQGAAIIHVVGPIMPPVANGAITPLVKLTLSYHPAKHEWVVE